MQKRRRRRTQRLQPRQGSVFPCLASMVLVEMDGIAAARGILLHAFCTLQVVEMLSGHGRLDAEFLGSLIRLRLNAELIGSKHVSPLQQVLQASCSFAASCAREPSHGGLRPGSNCAGHLAALRLLSAALSVASIPAVLYLPAKLQCPGVPEWAKCAFSFAAICACWSWRKMTWGPVVSRAS